MEDKPLPENWILLPLGDPRVCSNIRTGFACGDKEIKDGIPHLRMNNISSDGRADFSLIRRVPSRLVEKASRWLETGDVLFCNTNSTELVGKTCIFPGWEEACSFSNHLTRLRANREMLLPGWLLIVLRHHWLSGYFATHCKEFVGQSAYNQDKLLELCIRVPPVHEQARIVSRVEELTHRIEKERKTVIDREFELDALLQALYFRMIDGVEWVPLKEVASLVRRAIKTLPNEEYEEMGIRSFGKGTFKKPVLTGKQVGNKRIYRIHEGDLVFNNVFAWEKAIAVAKKEDHGRVGSHRFITYLPHERQATSEFLFQHFLSERGIEDIRAASPGSAGRNRTLGLKKLDIIPVPTPSYDEQKLFAEIVKRRQLIQKEAVGIDAEVKLFTASLVAKAFRGEL